MSAVAVHLNILHRNLSMKYLLSLISIFIGAVAFAVPEVDTYTGSPQIAFKTSGHGSKRILVVGDSRVRNTSSEFLTSNFGYTGWGERLSEVASLQDYEIVNCGIAGASIRSYINRGYWARVMGLVHQGDIVVMYFAGNDVQPIEDTKRSCGSVPGLGSKTRTIYNPYLRRDEVVLTFGSYYERIISDVKKLGGIPYICSYFSGNNWSGGGHVAGASEMFNAWINLIAGSNEIKIIDLHSLMENEFSARGESRSRELFVKDNFHLSKSGALVVARFVGDTIATGSFAEPKEFRAKP